jgi:hypothetical protein
VQTWPWTSRWTRRRRSCCRSSWAASAAERGFDGEAGGQEASVFLFTSRLGCLGSLLVSLVLTAVLFLLFTVW